MVSLDVYTEYNIMAYLLKKTTFRWDGFLYLKMPITCLKIKILKMYYSLLKKNLRKVVDNIIFTYKLYKNIL